MGSPLYDEIFDYSFDNILDDDIRFEKLIYNVKRYVGLSSSVLQQHYNSVFDKAVRNKKLAIKYATTVPDDIRELSNLVVKKCPDYLGPLNIDSYII